MAHNNRRYRHEDSASSGSGERTASSSAEVGYASSRTRIKSSSDARRASKRVYDTGNLQPFDTHKSFSILINHATDNVYITTTSSCNGSLEIHKHGEPRYDRAGPQYESRYEEYNLGVSIWVVAGHVPSFLKQLQTP